MKTSSAGFTLVEILVVIGIFSILLTIGTLQTRTWLEKGAIESQTMFIYGQLMEVRQSAMNYKRSRAVVIKRDSFQIYSTTESTVGAVANHKLKYPLLSGSSLVIPAGKKIQFDERGFTSINGFSNGSFCTEPTGNTLYVNTGAYDSIVISGLRLRVGKRTVEGAACADEDIQLK